MALLHTTTKQFCITVSFSILIVLIYRIDLFYMTIVGYNPLTFLMQVGCILAYFFNIQEYISLYQFLAEYHAIKASVHNTSFFEHQFWLVHLIPHS